MDEIIIDTDKQRLDIDFIHSYLSQSYWSPGIPRDIVVRSIEHALCFGVYHRQRQIGFARAITDYTTFAYLADLFIDPEYQGRGLGKRLVRTIREHPQLQGLKRWQLVTADAQGLYRQFGFQEVAAPEQHMEIRIPDIYLKKS